MSISDRVLRESIYSSLAVIVIGCGIGIFAKAIQRRDFRWWALGLGSSGALFWMTREEGLWLVPAIVFLLASSAWVSLKYPQPPGLRWRRLATLALPLLVFAVADGACAAVNYHRYGIFTTSEFRYAPFLDAYGALLRVDHPIDEPFIPVPRVVRQSIYRESPSFRQLEPSLEHDWIGMACEIYPNPHACGDVPGFAFAWALRTAVAKAGHYRSGAAMRSFFTTLAQEVNDACTARRLSCGPQRSTLMPPMPWTQLARDWPRALYRAARLVIAFDETSPTQAPSQSDEAFRERVARFTHNEVAPSADAAQPRAGDVAGVAGWVYLPDHRSFSAQLYAGGDPLPIPLNRAEGSDVAAAFHDPGAHRLRFELAGLCPMPCSLLVVTGDRADLVALSAAAAGTHHLAASDGTLYLDRVTIVEGTASTVGLPAWPRRLKLRVLDLSFDAYHSAAPTLILAGFAAYLAMAASMFRGVRSPLLVVETALLGGAVALAAAVSLVDVSAYPAISSHYIEPCFAFVLLFASVALSDFGRKLTAWIVRRRVD